MSKRVQFLVVSEFNRGFNSRRPGVGPPGAAHRAAEKKPNKIGCQNYGVLRNRTPIYCHYLNFHHSSSFFKMELLW